MLHGQSDYFLFAIACVVLLALVDRRLRLHAQGRITPVTWIVFGAILACGFWIVGAVGNHERRRLEGMVEGLAPTYAMELERLGHATLRMDAAPDDPLYLSLIDAEMRWMRANKGIGDIHTVRRLSNNTLVYIVDSETDYDHDGRFNSDREERTPIGAICEQAGPATDRAFEGQCTFEENPFTNHWGTWVSAQAPMFDADGRVEAILGIDYPAGKWISAVQWARASAIGAIGALVIMLAACSGTIASLRSHIQERHRFATELQRAIDAAGAASRSKSEFLANMSHEIRTPMTAILGYADLLIDPTQSPSDRMDCIQIIRRNGVHLLSIINDILDISKIEAGRLTIERIETSPMQILAEVESLMRGRALEKGIQFKVEYVGSIPETISTDPTRLRQILVNLVGNAIKFTTTGEVRIACELIGPADDLQQSLRFLVIDTGIGLTAAQQEHLFTPFVQGDNSTTRQFGGTGLGLTISRELATMLGGDITFESNPCQGSVFKLEIETGPLDGVTMLDSLPEAQCVAPSDGIDPLSEPRSLTGMRILLAEDGPDNQKLISFVLRKVGAEVVIVENGKKAVTEALAATALERNAPDTVRAFDVILMDMQMPEMDGYAAASLLRSKGYAGAIIALTAHAMSGDRERCIKAGCNDYATKPIDRAKLLKTIARNHQAAAPQ